MKPEFREFPDPAGPRWAGYRGFKIMAIWATFFLKIKAIAHRDDGSAGKNIYCSERS